jgi:hypothetical protein
LLVLLGVVGVIGAVFAGRAIFGASSYEECMVREMRGQVSGMISVVKKLCERRFKKEVSIGSSDVKYEWRGTVGMAHIRIINSGEYNLTRMKATFSSKPCSEAKNNSDFDLSGEGQIAGDDAAVLVGVGTEPHCMRAVEFYGTYK